MWQLTWLYIAIVQLAFVGKCIGHGYLKVKDSMEHQVDKMNMLD
jgi:hypothetical protein